MLLGKVLGTVVSTQKTPKFSGFKLLYVQPFASSGDKFVAQGSAIVAADVVAAGEGEFVMLTQGSSARLTETTRDCPVDAVIVGIVDSVQLDGRRVDKP